MEGHTNKTFSGQLMALVEANKDFPQKLKQHLVSESSKVENPFKFVVELFNEGVLSDGSNDLEAHCGFKEILFILAVTIGCSKGSDGIGGLVKALRSSGNLKLISALRTWSKEKFGIQTDGDPSKPKESDSAAQTAATKPLSKNVTSPTKSSSIGTKLIDKITSRVENDFMEQLQGHLVGKAPEIVNTTDFFSNLISEKALEETEIQLATGPKVQKVQMTENAVKAACARKAIGSLVLALQNSSNEHILEETYEWLETSQARKRNYPISVKSLANRPRPPGTGLFAATGEGLVSLDLRTLKVTALTSGYTIAVAVNHNLKKVYWSHFDGKSAIMRSDFDGSAKEVIVPSIGHYIEALAIDEPSGNIYFAPLGSHEIKVCNAIGKNCAVVISNSTLVMEPMDIAVDSENGFMYWGNGRYDPNSLVRANLDGTNARIISTGFTNLRGITFDQPSYGDLYWVDCRENTIATIDADGGNKRTLVELEGNLGRFGIQVDAHKIYCSNVGRTSIQSVDRNSGKQLTTIFTSTGGVHHLALFNATTNKS